MRKTAGVLVIIFGYFTAVWVVEILGLVDGAFSFWFVAGHMLVLSILCSIFTFQARYWKLYLILAILFGGVIPAFLIYQSRGDWER